MERSQVSWRWLGHEGRRSNRFRAALRMTGSLRVVLAMLCTMVLTDGSAHSVVPE
jgi:hypothetical protein